MYFTKFTYYITFVKKKYITFVNRTFYKIKMNNRIAEIIKMENLTNSQFAQLVGIQPSAVTHLLSGRNEPSIQVTKKILDTFRGINPEWFLFGVGDMYRKAPEQTENKQDTPKKAPSYPYQQSLFPEIPIPPQEFGKENELSAKEESEENLGNQPTYAQNMPQQENYPQSGINNIHSQPAATSAPVSHPYEEKREKPEPTPVAPRIVKKIIVFYSDNTYEEYGAQLNN